MVKSIYNSGCKRDAGIGYQSADCLRGRIWILFGLLASALVSASFLHAVSDNKNGVLRVTVTIPLRQSVTILSQASSIVVTLKDIQRGYVDIAAATRMVIRNNDKAGCLLLVQGLEPPFKKVLIYGFDREVEINSIESFVSQPYSKNELVKTLSYRFYLADDAGAGEYPWPLFFSIHTES